MYFTGKIVIDLEGTVVKMRPPSNFFAGVAGLLARGSWAEPEAQETLKLMSLAQATNRVLSDLGVRDAIRIALGGVVVYEDLKQQPNDFALAMESLRKRVEEHGLILTPHAEFDLIFSHDDGELHYIIDLDFFREHRPAADPLSIRVTATCSELRRQEGETEEAYLARVQRRFLDQRSFDAFRARMEERFKAMLASIAQGFRKRLGVQKVSSAAETRFVRPGGQGDAPFGTYAGYGYPFYGYDPMWDLYYLMVWDHLFLDRHLHARDFTYVRPDGGVLATGSDTSWSPADFSHYEASHSSDGGGGGSIAVDVASSDAGGGGAIDAEVTRSDAGGGGWLDSISSIFHGGDSGGGGGDVSGGGDGGGGGDAGGGSSCSSCGGGGGCGGCGSS